MISQPEVCIYFRMRKFRGSIGHTKTTDELTFLHYSIMTAIVKVTYNAWGSPDIKMASDLQE